MEKVLETFRATNGRPDVLGREFLHTSVTPRARRAYRLPQAGQGEAVDNAHQKKEGGDLRLQSSRGDFPSRHRFITHQPSPLVPKPHLRGKLGRHVQGFWRKSDRNALSSFCRVKTACDRG